MGRGWVFVIPLLVDSIHEYITKKTTYANYIVVEQVKILFLDNVDGGDYNYF